jgi:hypothetical protein
MTADVGRRCHSPEIDPGVCDAYEGSEIPRECPPGQCIMRAAQPSESEREGARCSEPQCGCVEPATWGREDERPAPPSPPSTGPLEHPQDAKCSRCRCQAVGLPTPGYPHDEGCPRAPSTGQSREPLAEVLRETVEGLQFYGRHLSTCAMKQRASFVTGHEEPPCTCGLEACVVAARRALESKP